MCEIGAACPMCVLCSASTDGSFFSTVLVFSCATQDSFKHRSVSAPAGQANPANFSWEVSSVVSADGVGGTFLHFSSFSCFFPTMDKGKAAAIYLRSGNFKRRPEGPLTEDLSRQESHYDHGRAFHY